MCLCVLLARIHLTSKQIKNLANGRLGRYSSDDRLRTLLDKFVSLGDNTCVLVEDDMDLSCVNFVQTEAQQRIFEKSGECLIMDFTHNTNNLGYYLVHSRLLGNFVFSAILFFNFFVLVSLLLRFSDSYHADRHRRVYC